MKKLLSNAIFHGLASRTVCVDYPLNMDKGLYLFENEHGYVTQDGRLHQKDNSVFSGRELASCTEETMHDIVAYYQNAFENLEKYVAGYLAAMESGEGDAAALKGRLIAEIKAADAIGNFDALCANLMPIPDNSEGDETDAKEEAVSETEVSAEQTNASIPEAEAVEDGKPTEEHSDDSSEQETVSQASEEQQVPDNDESFPVAMPPLPEQPSEVLAEFISLTAKALEMAQLKDFSLGSSELANIKHKWDIAEKVPSESEEELRAYNALFKTLQQAEEYFAERKSEHYQKLAERRQKDLTKRQELLDKLKAVIDNKKWQSFGEVKSIQRKWDGVRAVTNDDGKKQQAEFDRLLAIFEEQKIQILVERRQKEEENLAGKFAVLDKINALTKKVSEKGFDGWDAADQEVQELSKQWRKIGRVPKEQTDQIWDNFRAATDAYYQAKFDNNPAYQKELLRNVEKRKKLIEEAAQLTEEEDLALAARKANQLHRRWKKIGPVPKEVNDSLWEEFKKASDSFNEMKSENLDVIKEQEQENLDKKNALIERAQKIADEQDWKRGAQQLQKLMEEWKQIGPPPRRKASKTWNRFKEAMDAYYKPRREHFKLQKNEQKDNYTRKKEIIAEILALAEMEDAQEAAQKIKPLQQAFNDVGFVPIKKKDEIYQQYKEACDAVYQRARAESGNHPGTRHMEFAEGVSADDKKDARLKQVEINKLKKVFERLNDEVIRLGDTKTFIKPNKKGLQLRDEIQQKIDAAEAEKSEIEAKIIALQKEIDKVQQ